MMPGKDMPTHFHIESLKSANKELQENIKLLHAKQESLKLAQEIGHFGSWEIDLITKKSIWSEQSYRIYKLDPEKTAPTLDTFLSRVIPEDQEKLKQSMGALIDGNIHTTVVRAKREDGVIVTLLLNGKYIFDDNGTPIKMIGTTLDLTTQVKLEEENKELASIIENSSNEVYIIDKYTYNYLYVNAEAVRKLGYTREEFYKMNIFDINKEISPQKAHKVGNILEKEGSFFQKTLHTKKDGSTYPVQSYLQKGRYQGRKVGIIFDIDISDLLKAELKQKEQAQILEQIQDSVISTDLDGTITYWNNGATMMHGYTAEEMLGKNIALLHLDGESKKSLRIIEQTCLYGVYQDQIIKVTKEGKHIYANITASVFKNELGKIIGVTRYSQDITQKKEIEEKFKTQTELLNFQAYHDSLTELPNRALFEDRLQQSITHASRHAEQFALLFIDLDNFKQINDTLGHHYGDEVLKLVAQRLTSCIREEDTLSRVGGDEFTLIIQNLKTLESITKVTNNILDILRPKMVIDGYELHISASIGISLYPKDSVVKNNLLKYADTAMYKAKAEGRDNYQFYSTDMTLLALEKAVMETNLHKAVLEKQFMVYYQPQIDINKNCVVGVEALVRWQHPQMGLILPDTFIPLAEESKIIHKIDNFVMKQAMTDIQNWYSMGLNPGILSLNLSIRQLMSNDFIKILKNNLEETHLDPKHLEFEITESQMMSDPIKSIEVLQTISTMGIGISIDDFGTGYSSLAYLKRLPVNKLKIDRSFIEDLPYDLDDAAITKAVIALAKSLKLTIIAEGVETKEQLAYLIEHGCHLIQGYYYASAMKNEEIIKYIQKESILPMRT